MPLLAAHLLETPDPEWQQYLQEAVGPSIELTFGRELPEPAVFDILVSGRPERSQIEASPQLRMLVIPWAGIPESTRQLMEEYPHVAVHNLHHNAAMTAEAALALLLAAAKWVVPFDRDLRRNDWTRRYSPTPALLLDGKTVLVLGFGEIGRRVGRACHALGMEVLAVRRSPQAEWEKDYPAEVHPPEALHALLRRAHALVITLPATPETEGLIGERELTSMPEGGLLVNVGRGPVVEEAALYQALQSGRLAGAGLDVWYRYPESREERSHTPPGSYPFHELDNLVMSPHRGGAVRESERVRMQHLARLLNAAASGGPAPNRVNLEQGY